MYAHQTSSFPRTLIFIIDTPSGKPLLLIGAQFIGVVEIAVVVSSDVVLDLPEQDIAVCTLVHSDDEDTIQAAAQN